ncbi:MAG: Crp/Fnr family transcriptional regulator [Firmicutes bacterium]|nr:Crp/Fnr family transcriptional regulator [Bacillota bacterium]
MIDQLKEFPHFAQVEREKLADLLARGKIIRRLYRSGLTVHEQHEKCTGMDIVYTGKLVAYSLAANGSETVVFEFASHSVIGANLLYGDQTNYPMNIYCTEDCVIFHLDKSAITELLRDHAFVLPFVQSLSFNSQGMNQKIVMFTQNTLRENISHYLTVLSAEQKSKVVTLPISKKQLADHLGVQRPSLFRELKKMKDQGLIEIDNRIIKICY